MGENHNQMLEFSTRPSTSVDYYNLLFKLLTMIYAVDNEIHGKLARRVDISLTLLFACWCALLHKDALGAKICLQNKDQF